MGAVEVVGVSFMVLVVFDLLASFLSFCILLSNCCWYFGINVCSKIFDRNSCIVRGPDPNKSYSTRSSVTLNICVKSNTDMYLEYSFVSFPFEEEVLVGVVGA